MKQIFLKIAEKSNENDSGGFKVKSIKKQIISGEIRRSGVNLPEVYKILTPTKISIFNSDDFFHKISNQL